MSNKIANAFGSTFAFLQTQKAQLKMQKSYQANAQGQCKLDTTAVRPKRATSANSTFAIGGVSYSADSLVVAESFVLRIKFSGKNPAHRKSANRYRQG